MSFYNGNLFKRLPSGDVDDFYSAYNKINYFNEDVL